MDRALSVTRTTTVTILVDHELRHRLEDAAHEHDRSLGAECRVALRKHLDEQEKSE